MRIKYDLIEFTNKGTYYKILRTVCRKFWSNSTKYMAFRVVENSNHVCWCEATDIIKNKDIAHKLIDMVVSVENESRICIGVGKEDEHLYYIRINQRWDDNMYSYVNEYSVIPDGEDELIKSLKEPTIIKSYSIEC